MLVVAAEGGYFPDNLILASVFWAAAFGFFAFGHSDDDSFCFSSTSDDPIDQLPDKDGDMDGSMGTVDVAARLNTFFLIGFYIQVLQAIVGISTRFIDGYDLTRLLYNIYHMSQLAFLLLWIYGFIVRFSPSGQACAGTFEENYRDGALYQQCAFLLIAGLIVFFVFGMTLLNSVYRQITGKGDTL